MQLPENKNQMRLPNKKKKVLSCTKLGQMRRSAPRTGITSEPTPNVTIHEVVLSMSCVVKKFAQGHVLIRRVSSVQGRPIRESSV